MHPVERWGASTWAIIISIPISFERNAVVDKNPSESSFDISKSTPKQLADLIRKEGDNFITQLEAGIPEETYLEEEKFDVKRILDLYLAFEYFSSTEHGQESGLSPVGEKPEYMALYAHLHNKIETTLDMNLFGSEYLIKL
jgi:nucleoside-specific outer membrane channel protein Tsx